MDQVAANLQISKKPLYNLFESKENLIDFILQQRVSRINEIWSGIGANGTTVLPVIPEMQKHANAQVDLKKQKG